MKIRLVILMLLLAVITPPVLPQLTQRPLSKDQVMGLIRYGMSSADLAEKIKKLSIDFDPTDDYLQALQKAGAEDAVIQALRAARPQPLTRDQVGKLVAGGVPSEHAATLVTERGVDFLADEQYIEMLRLAGANDMLISAVREANAAATAQLVVETSPNAEVYLDNEIQGHASAQGELTLKAKLGGHALKVSLAAKKNFEQSVTISSVQATKIKAPLADAPGSIRLKALAGASVSLDGANRGSTDARGELVLADVPPGPHDLRVSAEGKRDFRLILSVVGGEEHGIDATLADLGGSLRVQTLAGAEVFLDDSSRGEADASGQIDVPEVAAGSHQLRVSARERQEYRQTVSVFPGQESRLKAMPKPLPQLRFPVQIEQGFMDASRRAGYLNIAHGRIKYQNENDSAHEFDALLSEVTGLRVGKCIGCSPMIYFRVSGSQYKFYVGYQPEKVKDAIERAMREH